jgi:hypothetical protein
MMFMAYANAHDDSSVVKLLNWWQTLQELQQF